MRGTLAASIALASLQQALAQESFVTHAPTTTLSPEEIRSARSSYSDAESTRSASLSSRIGPFYESAIFMPEAQDGDYIRAIGSSGATTTWAAIFQFYIDDSEAYTSGATEYDYLTATIGPTTYMQTSTGSEWTVTGEEDSTTNTYSASTATVDCSHTFILPKISWPVSSAWSTVDMETWTRDNWYTESGVCTYVGERSLGNSKSSWHTTVTYDEGHSMVGRRAVIVLGVEPTTTAAVTESGEVVKQTAAGGVAAQTGSGTGTEGAKATTTQAGAAAEVTAWVNAVVVVAAAAVMAI